MHEDRSADPAHLAGSVRGLGVCDVFRVELQACQHAVLTAELARRSAALDAAIRDRLAALRARPERRAGTGAPAPDAELEDLHAQARTLERVRDQLPACPDGPFVVVAPAALAGELVTACLSDTVATLAAGLESGGAHPVTVPSMLRSAAAWIRTALDWQAVEAFCLLPGIDPIRAA